MKTETILLVGLAVVGVIVIMKVTNPAPVQTSGPDWAKIGTGAGNLFTSVANWFGRSKDSGTDSGETYNSRDVEYDY